MAVIILATGGGPALVKACEETARFLMEHKKDKYGIPIYYGPSNPCPWPQCPTCNPKPKPEKKKK